MIQAYNYMLESYPVKREVMYPAHKRSELKKVYNNIVNLSMRSPIYKINLSKENQEYTFGMKETALTLKAKLEEMSVPEKSGFQTKNVSISDERVLSAKLLDKDTEGLPENITFKVDSLATAQVNKGKELLLSSKGLPSGEYSFSASIMDETYDLTYEQDVRKENGEAMKSMVEFLNQSLTGITASVEKGKTSDYGRITIASDQSGRYGEKDFTFEDTEFFQVGIIDFFGLDRVVTPASTARFELNGMDKQTTTNTFNLENKLRVTLQNTSDQPVTVRIVPDSTKILTAVDSVLTTYNNLIGLAKNRTMDNQEHFKASKLINEMKGLEKLYREELEASGLKTKEDGMLTLDDSLAVQAAEDGGMESLFTRENGFITRLLDKAETIAINPMEYLDKTIVTYPNSNDTNSFRNPYVTSMYSGLFFSSYC